MSINTFLADDEAYVDGRSEEKARELLALAAEHGLENSVRTTSHGYIVPQVILGADEVEGGENPDADADADADGEEAVTEFDPSEAKVADVLDYLNGADETERERVLAAEEAGKARTTVLAFTPEGDK
jgi:hypothetical protein